MTLWTLSLYRTRVTGVGALDAGLEVLQSASEFDSDEGDGDYHTYAYSDPFEWAY